MQKKILLKVGGRKHLGECRWIDALDAFDEIYCACIYREDSWENVDDRIHIIELKKNLLNHFLTGIILKTRNIKFLTFLNWLIILLLRLFNISWLMKIKNSFPDFALCSYGDYDRSDLTFLIAKPVIKCQIVRAYKETRVGFNFLEYQTLKSINKYVFYAEELREFLEKKYGDKLFLNKNIKYGLYENALSSHILNQIKFEKKLSSYTEKRHIVILSYRVDSAPNRDRDQGRYYYIETIKELINAGLIVHLHCARYNNYNGQNEYEKLKEKYPNEFFMEDVLNMNRDSSAEEWVKSCEILSKYDFGLMHNIMENSSVSEFDKINVPHRLFAYEAAHVIPIIREGQNKVLERMFCNEKCGIVYQNLIELSKTNMTNLNYYTPSYKSYLAEIQKW